MKTLAYSFRNEQEARRCYDSFDRTVCVSEYVRNDFVSILDYQKPCCVLYNTVESQKILEAAEENVDFPIDREKINLIAVGTLKETKGYDRLLRIVQRLKKENYRVHLYILGVGPKQEELQGYVRKNQLDNDITFLGYDTNPYKYVAKCDLFVCASYAEGFSTAATEALILGVPVCTVEVSGMKEMLGENNEYGVITDNNETALFEGIQRFFERHELLVHYQEQSAERGKRFSKEQTVKAVEIMLEGILKTDI